MERPDAREVVARRAHTSALALFRGLPVAVRLMLTHAISPAYCVGAVAVCVDSEHRVLLVHSRHQNAWSLPGGLLKRRETPSAALTRELREELGVAVDVADLDAAARVLVDPRSRQVTVVFGLTLPATPVADGVEVVEVGWFAAPDLPAALLRGTRESLDLLAPFDR